MVQTLIVALLVLAAAVYVGRRAWRTLRPARGADAGCAHGCGCGDTSDASDASDASADADGDWARTQ
jgi:hypothetical protein